MHALSAAYEHVGPLLARRLVPRSHLAGPLRRALFAPLARLLQRRERG
jgi:hypothetical protein